MSTICANQDLFVDLNETDAETISGGIVSQGGAGPNEIFKIENQLVFGSVSYRIDNGPLRNLNPGQSALWFSNQGGKIMFDSRPFIPGFQGKIVNAANGREYAFRRAFPPFFGGITLANIGAL
ncbi:hypothetical protein BJP34_25100 [Moorena producens PAL-8-15-08-1]|uniref:Uncharacterized protein n=1 Tax=Moorena producens PAL-8-15-08-1 TaxID=1458985 RepID=A0A1D8TXH3_9CYAN|nr:hypothetical protein [Moorena producens]AOX02284.1 hypothetical protein BJP34_25100 [Moorena producens PAL-8-15-08-1]